MQDNDYGHNEAEEVALHLPMFTPTIKGELPSYDTKIENINGVPYVSNSNPLTRAYHTGAEVINEMNNHYGLYSWFCHGGSGFGWNNQCSPIGTSGIGVLTSGINNGIYWKLNAQKNYQYCIAVPEANSGLDDLINSDYPSVLYSISCNVTPFDCTEMTNNNGGAMNCGEAFTTLPNAGGVAFLGNTEDGFYDDNSSVLYAEFADLITWASNKYCSSCTRFLHLGISEALSKYKYNGGYAQYLKFSHNLIGCPETEMWTVTPQTFTVSYNPKYFYVNESNSITINIQGLTPGQQATICLYKAGVSHNTDEVFQTLTFTGLNNNQTNSFTFAKIKPLTPGYVNLTITSQNYIPYQAQIPVINCNASCNNQLTISNTTTWSNPIFTPCNILINNNSTLTIKNTLFLKNDINQTITVESGSTLIVDNGGLITSNCEGDDSWDGTIDIKPLHQYTGRF